jgi:hypothetical protein
MASSDAVSMRGDRPLPRTTLTDFKLMSGLGCLDSSFSGADLSKVYKGEVWRLLTSRVAFEE